MATDLDVPIPSAASIVRQQIVGGRYVLHIDHETGVIDLANSFYEYTVESRDSTNSVLRVVEKRVFVPDLPAAFKLKLKDIHTDAITHAKSLGLIGSGTDSVDI